MFLKAAILCALISAAPAVSVNADVFDSLGSHGSLTETKIKFLFVKYLSRRGWNTQGILDLF